MTTEDKGWDDPDIDKEMKNKFEKYAAKENNEDIIRIISKPRKYYVHRMPAPTFYCTCGKPNQCLLCEREYDRIVRVGCLIVHLAQKPVRGDDAYRTIGEIKVWLFGPDKWNSLQRIKNKYKQIKADGLTKHDFYITCEDEQFQRIEILPTFEPSRLTKEMLVDAKKAMEKLEWYTQPSDMNRQKTVLGETVDDEDREERNTKGKTTSQPAKPAAKAKPAVPDPDAPGDAQEDPHQDLLPDADANATKSEVDDLLSDLEGDEDNPL